MYISVIVPSYNHARFLPKRIDSILEQTYNHFELIFLDDCSKDDSREVIKQYAQKDSRIQYFFNDQNSGSTFKQWNKGVALAKGDYVWIAESDDWAENTFLENLTSLINGSKQNIGIAYSQSYEVDENDQVIASRTEWTKDLPCVNKWNENYINTGVDEINENLYLKNTIPNASATLLNREAMLSVGMANENMKYVGDWHLYVKILKQYNIAYHSKHLNYNRRHYNSLRSRKKISKLAVTEILSILHEMDLILDEEKKNCAYQLLANRWAESLLHDASKYSLSEMYRCYYKLYPFLSSKEGIYKLMLSRALPF